MWRLKLLLGVFVAALPGFLKIRVYRWCYGYQIGRGVRIGFSPFIGVGRCVIGDHVRIGSFNLFYRVTELTIGDHTQIGFGNIIRGGQRVAIGAYVSILRLNVFNAILDGDFLEPVSSTLELHDGAVVTSAHWLDFSDRITVGAHSIIGGRNSSLWTHNRQRTRAIHVGDHCYLGSEVRFAPGVTIPAFSIVALGSVVVGELQPDRSLIGGNPASVLRPLGERDLYLVCRRTRKDIPDELLVAGLPDDLRDLLRDPKFSSSPPSA
jgi:acetyltransferase-like isoleucine patch superfamily enzyme